MKKKTEEKNKFQDLPLYLFHQGTNYNAYDFLGAHLTNQNGKKGVVFRVWAPTADNVSVVGDFNDWNKNKNLMTRISPQGVLNFLLKTLRNMMFINLPLLIMVTLY